MKKQLLFILMSILTFAFYSKRADAQGYIAASTYIGGSQLEQNARVAVIK